jgi:hypothetical protein
MRANPSWIVRKPIQWAIILASLLFAQIVPAASTSAATLTELFRLLADLPNANAVTIELGWQGLSPISPVQAKYLLGLHNDQFEGQGRFKVATAAATRDIVVPRNLIRQFLAAAIKVTLVEQEYKPRITHTDDYPSVAITVQTQQGELSIETRSQPHRSASEKWDVTPWAIRYSGRTFVVAADDLDRALDPLLPRLQYDEVIGELAKELRSSHDRGR